MKLHLNEKYIASYVQRLQQLTDVILIDVMYSKYRYYKCMIKLSNCVKSEMTKIVKKFKEVLKVALTFLLQKLFTIDNIIKGF